MSEQTQTIRHIATIIEACIFLDVEGHFHSRGMLMFMVKNDEILLAATKWLHTIISYKYCTEPYQSMLFWECQDVHIISYGS